MKNRKVILLILFLVVSITLCSCKNKDSSRTKNNYNKIDKLLEDKVYTIEGQKYEEEKGITIIYPKIKYKDEEKSNIINSIIKFGAVSIVNYYKGNGEFNLYSNYNIARQDDEILSIIFEGYVYSNSGSIPLKSIFYTVNIDLVNNKLLRLSDFVDINEEFVSKLKNGKVEENKKSYLDKLSNEEIMQKLQYCDNTNEFAEAQSYSYLTKDSLGISLCVDHSLGNHIESEISLKGWEMIKGDIFDASDK